MGESKTVLITGSNSGLGRATAETLAARGHTVFASMRQIAGKNAEPARELRAFAESQGARLHVVELDVCDDASVARAVEQALAIAGHLDVVVNNAAVGTLGLLEAYTPAQMRDLFDVNVGGAQRVDRAVLPHMRERKSGLLVHVSSAGGRIVFPAMAAYCATKFALEALAEGYHYELAATGVESVLVQPGGYPTDFMAKVMAPAGPEPVHGYGPATELPHMVMAGFAAMGALPEPPDPRAVADAVAGLIDMPAGTRPLRTAVDWMMGEGLTAINEVAEKVVTDALQTLGMGALIRSRS